jgi:2-(1,2-epoxy-1,2-dihydrophenyl)acetyl-CoA isomerase
MMMTQTIVGGCDQLRALAPEAQCTAAEDRNGIPLLLSETHGHICRITLNRPERLNALNFRIGVELLDALDECARDADVRTVVLTGAGRAFCAGDDLRGMSEPGEPERRFADPIKQYVQGEGRWPLIIARMRSLSKPVIAMINGHAHGAGFNLALGCDLRVMADSATLSIPFSKRGISTGTNLLQQFVGIGKAMEWALLAPTLTAQEAERWGLANRVVAPQRLEEETMELARSLAAGPTLVLAYTKSAIVNGWQQPPGIAYRLQGQAVHHSQQTDDLAEGIRAFREKRPPQFTGR